jgi:hypothetical protein
VVCFRSTGSPHKPVDSACALFSLNGVLGMRKRVCSVRGCNRSVYGHELCEAHCRRRRLYGHPFGGWHVFKGRLTAKRLRQLLYYNPKTGVFRWRKATRTGVPAGAIAGMLHTPNGGRMFYRWISIDGRKYKAHRLAWLYMTGRWPVRGIDHKNRVGTDNRWTNLRLATASQNHGNSRFKPGISGLRGVFRVPSGRYRAHIGRDVEGRSVQKYLGTYATAQEAHEAYRAAAKKRYGEFFV